MMVINNYLYIAIDLVLYRMTNYLKPTLVVETIFENKSIVGLTASPAWDDSRYFYLLLNDGSLYRNNIILTNDLILITKLTSNDNVVLTVQSINFWKNSLLITGQQTEDNLEGNIFFFITQDNNISVHKLENNLNIIDIWV